MSAARGLFAAAAMLLALLLGGCASGLRGGTFVLPVGGGIGATIPGVSLSFVKEDGSAAFATASDANGRYSISLAPGRYYMLASHQDYEDYNSAPGFAVVNSNTRGTANFFLREPQLTTVLIARHGEKQDPNSNAPDEPLSADGQARAQALRATLLRAGVTAVYATDTRRTRDTAAPLAAAFRLNTEIYADANALAGDVLAQHRGDVVLVVAHSNTVATVANAFGTQLPTASIADFDNLYVVSVPSVSAAGAASNAVNLQYAADSTPDATKNDGHAMTLLLVGISAPAGTPEPQQLLHAARKAGVNTIYSSTAANPLVAPLATALGLTPVSFNGNDMPAFTGQLINSHPQDTVMVAASSDELRALIRQFGGYPFPVIYNSDLDHMIVLTRLVSGELRVVPLRF